MVKTKISVRVIFVTFAIKKNERNDGHLTIVSCPD